MLAVEVCGDWLELDRDDTGRLERDGVAVLMNSLKRWTELADWVKKRKQAK
jgi:hypothetical protein